MLRIGLWVLALGCGPLVAFLIAHALGLLADPNPNPIGLGLLCMVSLPLGIILAGIGLIQSAAPRRDKTGG